MSGTFRNIVFFLSLFVFFCAVVPRAYADATLFVSPITGNYLNGDEIRLGIMLSSPDTPVNAAEGSLEYDPKEFRLERIDTSRSLIVSWTKMPADGDPPGTISFAGAFASSATADRGTLFEIILTPLRSGELRLRWGSGAAIHAADGTGGNIVSALSGGVYLVEPKNSLPELPEASQDIVEELSATSSAMGEVLGATDVVATSTFTEEGDRVATSAPVLLSPSNEQVADAPSVRGEDVSSSIEEFPMSFIEIMKRHPIIPIGTIVLVVLLGMTVYLGKNIFMERSTSRGNSSEFPASSDPYRVSLKK